MLRWLNVAFVHCRCTSALALSGPDQPDAEQSRVKGGPGMVCWSVGLVYLSLDDRRYLVNAWSVGRRWLQEWTWPQPWSLVDQKVGHISVRHGRVLRKYGRGAGKCYCSNKYGSCQLHVRPVRGQIRDGCWITFLMINPECQFQGSEVDQWPETDIAFSNTAWCTLHRALIAISHLPIHFIDYVWPEVFSLRRAVKWFLFRMTRKTV